MDVALGWGHALARTKEGKLYGWGYSANGRLGFSAASVEPKLQKQSSRSSVEDSSQSIAFRLEVAEKLVLEDLEKEKHLPINWEPCLVNALNHFQVVDIACGLDHSLVLCGIFLQPSLFDHEEEFWLSMETSFTCNNTRTIPSLIMEVFIWFHREGEARTGFLVHQQETKKLSSGVALKEEKISSWTEHQMVARGHTWHARPI
eukprot:Gb_01389 [translate_table: standard]